MLHVPSMDMNLVPPFILIEAGLDLQDVSKIYVKNHTMEDHSIYFSAVGLRISLSLHGIFSYFVTRSSTDSEIEVRNVMWFSSLLIINPKILTMIYMPKMSSHTSIGKGM